jgi:hypothetical protein
MAPTITGPASQHSQHKAAMGAVVSAQVSRRGLEAGALVVAPLMIVLDRAPKIPRNSRRRMRPPIRTTPLGLLH